MLLNDEDKFLTESLKPVGDKKDTLVAQKSVPPEGVPSEIPGDMAEDDQEEHKEEEEEVAHVEQSDASKPKKIWVDFDHFSICFK